MKKEVMKKEEQKQPAKPAATQEATQEPVKQDQGPSQEVAVMETQEAPAVSNGNGNESLLSPVEFNGGDLPDLDNALVVPVDLIGTYWTPENIGESKRVFFDCIKEVTVLEQKTGELIQLLCAFFYEKTNGQINTISNGSKRLVGLFEGGNIPRMTPLEIKYTGKKKATSGNLCDTWSVRPLSLNL